MKKLLALALTAGILSCAGLSMASDLQPGDTGGTPAKTSSTSTVKKHKHHAKKKASADTAAATEKAAEAPKK